MGNRLSCKITDSKYAPLGDANTQVYDYDNLYQLIYVDYNDGNTTNYYYDALGNRILLTNGQNIDYMSNSLNQYVEVNDINFIYDKNGNLLSSTGAPVYDCENRLVGLMTGKNVSYKYNYAGRRVVKSRFNPQPYTITQYTYDGEQIIADYNAFSGVLVRKYVYGPGIDEPICMIDVQNGNAMYYYHYDGLGSVVALSNDNAQIVETYSYEVFGKTTIKDANGTILLTRASAFGNPFMFTGREYDSETGLYYYRARYYRPEIGRFMQVDPLEYRAGLNLYAYVKNNPVNLIDPYGKRCCSECQEAFDSQRARAQRELSSCMADCGIVMSPGEAICVTVCAFTPFPATCVFGCGGIGTIGGIICGSGCMDVYEALMDSSQWAYNRCMRDCDD